MKKTADDFSRMAALPDDRIDLAKAALLISRIEYPQLDESYYLARLDDLAGRLRPSITRSTSPEEAVNGINRLLFIEEGFRGNEAEYYDPRNSFLNQVLDRKLGIPITLSLVYILVGRRVGLEFEGIGLPGHFLTALNMKQRRLLIDPFHQGKILAPEDFQRLAAERFEGSIIFEEDILKPLGPRKILARLLRNLKGIYKVVNDQLKYFQVIQWILELEPNAPLELRDRGLLYESMGDSSRAVKDLERYLLKNENSVDTTEIKDLIQKLKNTISKVH